MNYKSKNTAILLALFLGGLGGDRFYLGQSFTGLMSLLFCWTFIPMILSFFQAICYMSYSQAKWDLTYNQEYILFTKLAKLEKKLS